MLTRSNFTLRGTNRESIRREVVGIFLDEFPGTGTGDNCSEYEYTVETSGIYSITLKRPARLNKGMDFVALISTIVFKHISKKNPNYIWHDNIPQHDDIIEALSQIRTNPNYNSVKTALTQIYNCSPYNSASISGITFADYTRANHPIEIILLAAKWLFIEQDVTYWNWSGRDMLWEALRRNGLV